jgi:membrane protein YdbS with pleckstrin-like domain
VRRLRLAEGCEAALLSDKALKYFRWQSLLSTAGLVSVINGAIAGVFAGITARAFFGAAIGVAVSLGILLFLTSVVLYRRYHVRTWTIAEQRLRVMFPSAS